MVSASVSTDISTMSRFGFSANFSAGDVHKQMQEFALRVHNATVTTLQYIGERCVAEARENGSYQDRTGNLRNSVGYVIVYNGSIISENFAERVNGKVASEVSGMEEGQKVAELLAANISKGYALIVVAGMHYAQYVESLNYDVLDSAERLAERIVPSLLQQLKSKVAKL